MAWGMRLVFPCSGWRLSRWRGLLSFFFFSRVHQGHRRTPADLMRMLFWTEAPKIDGLQISRWAHPDVYDCIHMQGLAAFCRTALYWWTTAAASRRLSEWEKKKVRRCSEQCSKNTWSWYIDYTPHPRHTHPQVPNRLCRHPLEDMVHFVTSQRDDFHNCVSTQCSRNFVVTKRRTSLFNLCKDSAFLGGFSHSLEQRFPN